MDAIDDQHFDEVLERVQQVASEAYDSGEFEPLNSALLDAVASCATAEQLWRLLAVEPLDQATFIEDEHPPELAHALLARAESWQPEEAASAIGLACRASAFSPAPMLHREIDYSIKSGFAEALEQHVNLFRSGLRSPHASLRSACGHALARCRNTTTQDADELLRLVREEQAVEPLASFVLAASAVARRGQMVPDELAAAQALFHDHLAHPSPLVRVCAGAARALAGGRLDEQATAVLSDAITAPIEIPASWGWRWQSPPPETTSAIAVRIFGWAPIEASSVAVRAVRTLSEPAWLVAQALIHIAFADGAAIPKLGVALEELNEDQRVAIAALAQLQGESHELHRFGLWDAQFAAPFLAGEGPLWRPLDVETPDGRRRWHLTRIWRAVMWEEIPLEAGVDAIMGGLQPFEVPEAMCTRSRNVLLDVRGLTEEPAHTERDQRLALALVERLVALGYDPTPIFERMALEADEWNRTMLAVCLLGSYAWREGGAPDDLDAVIAEGIRNSRSPEPIGSLLARLDSERRDAIGGRVRAGQGRV